jgi:hypothetical protein
MGILTEARGLAAKLDAQDPNLDSVTVSSTYPVDVVYGAAQYCRYLGRSPHPFLYGRLVALAAVRTANVEVASLIGRWIHKHPNGGEMACGLVDHILHLCTLNAGSNSGQGQGGILRDTRHEALRVLASLLGNGTASTIVDRPHQGAVQTAYIRGIAAHLRGRKRIEQLENAALVLRHYDDHELSQKLSEEVYTKMWLPSVVKAQSTPTSGEVATLAPGDPVTPARQTIPTAKQLSPTQLSDVGTIRSPIVAPLTPSSAFSMPSPIVCPAPFTPPMPRYGPPTPPYLLEGFDAAVWSNAPMLPPPVFRPDDTFRHSPIIQPQDPQQLLPLGGLQHGFELGSLSVAQLMHDLVGSNNKP